MDPVTVYVLISLVTNEPTHFDNATFVTMEQCTQAAQAYEKTYNPQPEWQYKAGVYKKVSAKCVAYNLATPPPPTAARGDTEAIIAYLLTFGVSDAETGKIVSYVSIPGIASEEECQYLGGQIVIRHGDRFACHTYKMASPDQPTPKMAHLLTFGISDAETGKFVSYVSIPGIASEEECQYLAGQILIRDDRKFACHAYKMR